MSLNGGRGPLLALGILFVAFLAQGLQIKILLAGALLFLCLWTLGRWHGWMAWSPWALLLLISVVTSLDQARGLWHGQGVVAALPGPGSGFALLLLLAWAEELRLEGNWSAHWAVIPVSAFALIHPPGGIAFLPYIISGLVLGALLHGARRGERISDLISAISQPREKQPQEHPFFPLVPSAGETQIMDDDTLVSALMDAAGRINRKSTGTGSVKRTVYGFLTDVMAIFNFEAVGFWVFEEDQQNRLSFFMSRVRGGGDENRIRLEEDQSRLVSLLPDREMRLAQDQESQLSALRIGGKGDLWFIPLAEGEHRLGVFQAEVRGNLEPESLALIRGLLGHLAVGILNLRLADGVSRISTDLAQREFDFATLNLFSRIAGRSEDLERILDLSVELLLRVASLPAAGVAVLQDGSIGLNRFRGREDIAGFMSSSFIDLWPMALPQPGTFAEIGVDFSLLGPQYGDLRLMVCTQKVKSGASALFLLPAEKGLFTQRQRNFMDMLLKQVASVLETMTTLTELEKKVRLLRLIYAVCDSIAGTAGLDERMASISQVLCEFLGVGGCAIVIPWGFSGLVSYPSRNFAGISGGADFTADLLEADPERRMDSSGAPGRVFDFRTGSGQIQMQAVRLIYGDEMTGYLVMGGASYHFDMLERDFEVVRAVGVLTGLIAATHRMHSQVVRLKGFLHAVLDEVNESIIVVDQENRLAAINAPAKKMFVDSAALGTYRNASGGHIFAEDSDKIMNLSELLEDNPLLLGALSCCGTAESPAHGEDMVITEKGRILDIHSGVMKFSDSCRYRIITIRDITERQKMETELKRIERLAALGEMAAGIAHEIRNPLGGIKVITSFLMDSFDRDDERREMVETVITGIGDMNRKIGELLSFARPENPTMEPVDLSQLLFDTLEVYGAEAGELGIHIDTGLVPGPGNVTVWADGAKLSQVMGNVLRNSFQAMKRDGIIGVQVQAADRGVELIFQDDGSGMDQETLARAMNPFFTTKPEGTGLGLAISAKIMESMGGGINIESEPGAGTRVALSLARPPADRAVSSADSDGGDQ